MSRIPQDVRKRVIAEAEEHGLSDIAKKVASSWFGAGRVGSTLHFGMVQSRPTAEAQAALDEMVEKGVLSVTPDRRGDGCTYTSLVDCQRYFRWMALMSGMAENFEFDPAFNVKLTERIDGGKGTKPLAAITLDRQQ